MELFKCLLLIVSLSFVNPLQTNNLNETATKQETVLSRKRRYITFPEGSSFQLVFCLTVPTYAIKGGIFTAGLTASLAWQLPSGSYSDLRDMLLKGNSGNRRHDKNPVLRIDSKKPQAHWSYKPKITSNYYSYKSVLNPQQNSLLNPNNSSKVSYKNEDWSYFPTNDYSVQREPVKNYYYDEKPYYYHEIHRRTRRDLYKKLETFFSAQRKDGRACVLKALCEVSQKSQSEKGTFVEAILRVIFTWTPDSETEDPHYHAYNKAATHLEDCDKLYPSCDSSVFNIFY